MGMRGCDDLRISFCGLPRFRCTTAGHACGREKIQKFKNSKLVGFNCDLCEPRYSTLFRDETGEAMGFGFKDVMI